MWSDNFSGKLYLRHSMENIATGETILNKEQGKEVGLLRGDNERYWTIGSGFRPSMFNMLKQMFKK